MSIRIYEHKLYRGDDMSVSRNHSKLRGTDVGNNPSSIKMTGSDDTVLLCKNEKWGGGVFFLRGRNNIEDLGSKRKGGRFSYGNSISSVGSRHSGCA